MTNIEIIDSWYNNKKIQNLSRPILPSTVTCELYFDFEVQERNESKRPEFEQTEVWITTCTLQCTVLSFDDWGSSSGFTIWVKSTRKTNGPALLMVVD